MVDVHVFWDPSLGIDPVIKFARAHGVTRLIFSPPAVMGMTAKSASMYKIQRIMLRSPMLYPVARGIGKTFYHREGHLRGFWRLFVTGKDSYQKISVPDNAGLAKILEGSPAGIFRWHWMNPGNEPWGPDRAPCGPWLDDPRVAGLKLHPYWHGLTPEQVDSVLHVAKTRSLPVYIHLGFGELDRMVEVFRRHPEVTVILACGGFPHFDRVWRKVRKMDQVCIDVASYHIDVDGIRDAAKSLGEERCLFATDFPYGVKGNDPVSAYGEFLSRAREAFPDLARFKRVLTFNALKRIPRIAVPLLDAF